MIFQQLPWLNLLSYLVSTVIFFFSPKDLRWTTIKKIDPSHALYAFPVAKPGASLPGSHHFLCAVQQRHRALPRHKLWPFQPYLEIKCVIFLGKHTFHISCPKGRAVSHFLAMSLWKGSTCLNGIWFQNLSTCCADAQLKMVGLERSAHLGFYKISKDGILKTAKKKKKRKKRFCYKVIFLSIS